MKVPVTAAVRAEADRTFSPADADIACAALSAADLPLINNNGERVHLAILQLARGNLTQFQQQLSLAKVDWRDVLVNAGMA